MSLAEKRLFLLDMDGTIYLSETLFDGTLEFLRYVRAIDGRYLFLTNNSSRGTDAYIAKMARLGIEAFPDDFLTSADATIRYLRGRYLPDTVYYVCGTESLKNQLRLAGLRVAETLRDDCAVVLLGYDTELTYESWKLLHSPEPRRGLRRHAPRSCLPDMVRQRAGLRQRDRNAPYRDGPPPEGHRQAPARNGAAGYGADGLLAARNVPHRRPGVYRHRLRRERRDRHDLRPVRRGCDGRY